MDKLVEHYGIILGESSIRRITEGHARRIFETAKTSEAWPTQPGSSAVVIAQMDGGMVPIVEPDTTQSDQRKGKKLHWKEAKICLAHPLGSKTLSYGGTLQGDVAAAGLQLFDCAVRAGFGTGTHVHAVGDGAQWIADQVEDQFGSQGSYLLDFYHVCDYLSAAEKSIVAEPAGQKTWMDEQKHRLKTQRADELIEALAEHLGKEKAKTITEYIETKVEKQLNDKTIVFATKEDLSNTKSEIIKWMFIFWIGTIGVLSGIMFAMLNAYLK